MANEKAKEHFGAKKTEKKYERLLNNLLEIYGSIDEIMAEFDEIKSMGLVQEQDELYWNNFYEYLANNKKAVNIEPDDDFKEICVLYAQIEKNLNIIEETIPTESIIGHTEFLDFLESLSLDELETKTFKLQSVAERNNDLINKLLLKEQQYQAAHPEHIAELKAIRDKKLQKTKNSSQRTLEESTKLYCDIYKNVCQALAVKIQILNTKISTAKSAEERNTSLNQARQCTQALRLAAVYYKLDLQNKALSDSLKDPKVVATYVNGFTKTQEELDKKFYEQLQRNNAQQESVQNEVAKETVQNNPEKQQESAKNVEEYPQEKAPNDTSDIIEPVSNAIENDNIKEKEPLNEPVINPAMATAQDLAKTDVTKNINTETVPTSSEPNKENSQPTNNEYTESQEPEYQKNLIIYINMLKQLNINYTKINNIVNAENALLIASTDEYIKNICKLEKEAEPLFKIENEIKTRMNQLEYETLMKTGLILGISQEVQKIPKVELEHIEDFETFVSYHNAIINECYTRIKAINKKIKENETVDLSERENLIAIVNIENTIISRMAVAYKTANPSFNLLKFVQAQRENRKNMTKGNTVSKNEQAENKMPEQGYEKEVKFTVRLGKLNFSSQPQQINYQQNKISESTQFVISIIKHSIRIEYKKELVEKLRQLQAKIDITVQRNGKKETVKNEVLSSNSEKIYQIIDNPEEIEAAHITISDDNNQVISDYDLMQQDKFRDKVDEIKSSMHR